MKNLVCSFDLIPGLVIDFLGLPAIVIHNVRDHDNEIAYVTINNTDGELTFKASWAQPNTISVIGVTVDLQPDNIVLFDS